MLEAMRSPLWILVGIAVLCSCNLARIHTRKCDKRLEREFTAHTFSAPDGPHFTWYRNSGKEKLLLLHGYSGTGALQWSKSASWLTDDYDPIIPDLLCHGRSTTNWGDQPGGNIDAQVAHVVLLLDSLGIAEPISVVGNSYGGGVAARLAEVHPTRVKKLVIYDGLVSDYTATLADSIARSVGGQGMLAIMGTPTPKDLRFAIKLSLYRDPPLPGFLLKQIFDENVKPFRPAQITLIQDLMAHEELFVHKLYDWPMPVYFIWGERDELIPNNTGQAVMRRNAIPADHWITIPRTGHVANIERPRAFDRVLREVLGR